MGDITSKATFSDGVPNFNVKIVYVAVTDTEGAGHSVTIPNMATVYMATAVDASDNSVAATTVSGATVVITGDEANGVRMLVVGK